MRSGLAKAHSGKIINDEIEKLLHVSDTMAARYAKILIECGLLKANTKRQAAKYSAVR